MDNQIINVVESISGLIIVGIAVWIIINYDKDRPGNYVKFNAPLSIILLAVGIFFILKQGRNIMNK